MLIDFGDAIIKQANKKHVPALDLYRNSNINKETAQLSTTDGLHLTDGAGSELIGGKIASFLLSYY